MTKEDQYVTVPRSNRTSVSAFSLVELSIVLVILGLLTGGILTGQNLIRAAELRSVTTEHAAYVTAIYTFRDKYFYLPGDMPNATDFWGEAHATPATCKTTASTGTETCNGNGDGKLNDPTNGAGVEWFRAWQHMANAGLIEGRYNGVTGPGGNTWDSVIGENVPASRVGNAGWSIGNTLTVTTNANFFNGYYSHRLTFGVDRTNAATDGAVLSPEEAWNIDTKMDDGKPGLGKVRSYKNTSAYTPNCATTDDITTSEYALNDSSILCSLMFTAGW